MISRKYLVIGISGSPGTGKTTIASLLNEKLSAQTINLTEIALKHNFIQESDNQRDTKIVDLKKLIPFLEKTIESHSKNIIVEGHYADIIPETFLSILIILRTDPQVLEQRLLKKEFAPLKIMENLQAEILGSCTASALEVHDREKIYEVDTSIDHPAKTLDIILALINEQPPSNVGQINWLQQLDQNTLLKYFP